MREREGTDLMLFAHLFASLLSSLPPPVPPLPCLCSRPHPRDLVAHLVKVSIDPVSFRKTLSGPGRRSRNRLFHALCPVLPISLSFFLPPHLSLSPLKSCCSVNHFLHPVLVLRLGLRSVSNFSYLGSKEAKGGSFVRIVCLATFFFSR